jgi:tRNA-dependent cyclodipeptide synthase
MLRTKVNVFPATASADSLKRRTFVGVSLDNRLSTTPSHLRPVFDWTKNHLGSFDLLVGDYVNRHNYRALDGLTERLSIIRAKKEGENVAERLRTLLHKDGFDDVAVLSAFSVCADASFLERFARFERYYSERSEYRELIDEAVNSFLMRKLGSATSDIRVRDHCFTYQFEELALFELLAERGYQAFLYPGAQLPVMKSLVSGKLAGLSRSLESLILVEFRLFEDPIT